MKNTEIYYFSGTGNSLRVARELQTRLPGSVLIPVVGLLQKDKIKSRAENVGFVFPNFCLSIPIPLYLFLKKADLSSASYLFGLCTRGGSPSQAREFMDLLLKKQKKRINGYMNITMPWNHPVGEKNLARITPEKAAQLEREMIKKVETFSQAVRDRADLQTIDREITFQLSSYNKIFNSRILHTINFRLHDFMYQKVMVFYINAGCTGCGTCEKICLSNKIVMDDGKPLWQKKVSCYACYGCINYCPHKAIQARLRLPVPSFTEENERYHHPEIKYNDIAAQKKV
jgi:ferredoxin